MDKTIIWRWKTIKIIFGLIVLTFAWRLFDLQILQHQTYAEEARVQHEKRSVLPARRGKILVKKNYVSSELTPLATNSTLKMLFVDPLVLNYPRYNPDLELTDQEKGNPREAAKLLAPLLIHAHCKKVDGCLIETDPETWTPTEGSSIRAYEVELSKIFSEIERIRVVLATELAEQRLEQIESLKLRGISIEGQNLIGNPTEIVDLNLTAQALSEQLNQSPEDLSRLLRRRPKRYIKIVDKIVPEVTEAISKLKENPRYRQLLRGVQLRDEHWRYYPERELAAQVLGFVDLQGQGQYGLEGKFNETLRGKEGYIYGATSVKGQRILGKNAGITQAQDGADIVITIDRIIQGQVEKILAEDLERFQADFGQIIVVEPKTGEILAMANAPSFDPNNFNKAFLKYEITSEQIELEKELENYNSRIPIENFNGTLYQYFNIWGPTVFRNKIISDSYEPGSVMKALTMAAALNSDEVTPQTIFDDRGPVEVDEFKIRNSDEVYDGETNMIEVLSRSLNTGIVFITQKMGSKLWYQYLEKLGFGQFTDIELSGEEEGEVEFWQDWAQSELVTRGFGQGLTATPLQMTMAFASLANGGYLMKPQIIEEIRYGDRTEIFKPEVINRVFSDKTYGTTKSMLLNVVSGGTGRGARVKGYSIMGKTGTSQTYKNGKALEGLGTTIATFAGFGPIREPKFVVLVKYDYPKTSQWGSETAAVTFRSVAEFLFQYFEVPPDR